MAKSPKGIILSYYYCSDMRISWQHDGILQTVAHVAAIQPPTDAKKAIWAKGERLANDDPEGVGLSWSSACISAVNSFLWTSWRTLFHERWYPSTRSNKVESACYSGDECARRSGATKQRCQLPSTSKTVSPAERDSGQKCGCCAANVGSDS